MPPTASVYGVSTGGGSDRGVTTGVCGLCRTEDCTGVRERCLFVLMRVRGERKTGTTKKKTQTHQTSPGVGKQPNLNI